MALTKITERMKAKYGTLAEFVTAEAAGVFNSLRDGAVVYADGVPYKRQAGASSITGLPNWTEAPAHGGDIDYLNEYETARDA